MKHKFETIWYEDLEVWHCVRCGFETIDPSIDGNSKCIYWYEFDHYDCVMGDKSETYKCRIYDKPKPENYLERHHFHEYICWSHF